jgi:hypothetical protein
MLEAAPVVDGAILDIDLHGETSFPIADALRARDVSFVFTTGYDDRLIPASLPGRATLREAVRHARGHPGDPGHERLDPLS